MNKIKPIQTFYKGYHFRSRLEARWSVFFDALELKWEYEKEGFELQAAPYLPDFWISTVNMWAEVKPTNSFTFEESVLCVQLASYTGYPVLMLGGMPENRPYNGVDRDGFLCEYCLTNYHDYPQKEHRFFGGPAEHERQWQDTGAAVYLARSARFEHGETPTDNLFGQAVTVTE